MKILFRQFLGKNHSWANTGWGLAKAMIDAGHDVHLFSTDGTEHLPPILLPNLIGWTEENQTKVFGRMPDQEYNCQISYTTIKNFPPYLSSGTKNRFGIWLYEWKGRNVLPTGFAKGYKGCDYLCSPSQFGKQVFMESGIPEQHIRVIPHGIDVGQYQNITTIELPTTKTFKLGCVLGQTHSRKNIPGMLEAYGKAFTSKDDVCLILKAKDKPVKMQFEVSLKDCLDKFYRQFPKHAEVKVISDFIPDMSAFYRSVDATYSMTNCEGFYYPGLESMASGKLAIVPNWGGQLDFLNEGNALLVNGKEVRADPRSMYWESKNDAVWFLPSIDDAVDKLRYAHANYQTINATIDKQRSQVYTTYGWDNVARQFLELAQ